MGNAVGAVATDLWIGRHQQNVDRWLNNLTQDSILKDLDTRFFPKPSQHGALAIGRSRRMIDSIFENYGFVDANDGIRYWTEKEFATFLRSYYNAPDIDASTRLLWNCFHFFGHFPFQNRSPRMDQDAVRRSVTFLASGGIEHLGTDQEDVILDEYWKQLNIKPGVPRDSRNRHMIFRALSESPYDTSLHDLTFSQTLETTAAEECILDVLYMSLPCHNVCHGPPMPGDVLPFVRMIHPQTQYQDSSISRQGILGLFKLFLNGYIVLPQGSSIYQSPQAKSNEEIDNLDEIAEMLLERCVASEYNDVPLQTFDQALQTYLVRVSSAVLAASVAESIHKPNFPLFLRQIYAIFLGPYDIGNPSVTRPRQELAIELCYTRLIASCVLPSPQHTSMDRLPWSYKKQLLDLQWAVPIYSATEQTLSLFEAVTNFSSITKATLILVTGTSVQSEGEKASSSQLARDRSVFGILKPFCAVKHQTSVEKAQVIEQPLPILFQISPKLEILRPDIAAYHESPISIIHAAGVQHGEGLVTFGRAGGTGLVIDFVKRIAMMQATKDEILSEQSSEKNPQDQQSIAPYHDIGLTNNMSAGPWKNFIKIQELKVFDIEGTTSRRNRSDSNTEYPVDVQKPYRSDPRYGPDEKHGSIPKVVGDELKARIQGFGPGNLSNAET